MTEDDLRKMGMVKDANGYYRKEKTVPQPRDIEYKDKNGNVILKAKEFLPFEGFDAKRFTQDKFRTITLTLFGVPMPKQSVRSTKSGHHYQPQKTVDRKKDYQGQIKQQLPEGFIRFETEVHLTKFHCIFPPLKSFQKIKGRMDALRNGEIFYKNTKPDLVDNLKKLVFDSMSGIVCKDDSIVVTENDTAKYYGVGGCIIIELKGY